MEPEQLAERVWPGLDVSIEPLGGGITNRNFRVVAAGQEFVLRVGGKDTELLGIDRAAEHAASRVAADLGLGPEVVAFAQQMEGGACPVGLPTQSDARIVTR